MNDEDFKTTELKDLRSGLSASGKIRSAVLLGPVNGKVLETITDLGNYITQDNPESFWVNIDSQKSGSPYEWCSQFARNLRTKSGVPLAELAKFALNTGKSLTQFKTSEDNDGKSLKDKSAISGELVSLFEALVEKSSIKGSPHLVLVLNGLNLYNDEMLAWISENFNQAIRKSKAFKGCRFIFSSEQISDREKSFFDTFGFEKIHNVEVEPVPASKSLDTTREHEVETIEEKVNLPTPPPSSKVDSPKVLKKSALPDKLIGLEKSTVMDIKEAKKLLSSFSEVELNYLFLASYPARISKYSLGHFETERNAALTYNWLKRAIPLHTKHESGDLLLNEDLRIAARTLHANNFPDLAEERGTLSSIFDTFHQHFPIDDTHWIPLNLQLLESFNNKILSKLFSNGDQLDPVLGFIEAHPDQFIEKGKNLSLTDDVKIVVRRYLELSGKTCVPGLSDRIRDLWLKDQERFKSQKAKMLEEKNSITSEIEATLNQVANLKELKDDLTENFNNPTRNKAQKTYSFSSSRLLIVIGLVTVGISLFADSVGSYHAACGLALTLFGFFWPNVETKRPALAMEGPKSNLAIETQHRSLNHRMGSLSNRVQIMKANLDAVETQLLDLGDNPPLPYLETDGE